MVNEKNTIKTSRASETRTKTDRPKVWTPPSSLDAPPAPDGFRHRWIRAESAGFDDTKNISGKLRSGWEFVRSDEYPDSNYPQSKTENTQESLELAAYCWLGYPKRSQNLAKSTLQKELKTEKKLLQTILLRNSTQVCRSAKIGKLV